MIPIIKAPISIIKSPKVAPKPVKHKIDKSPSNKRVKVDKNKTKNISTRLKASIKTPLILKEVRDT